MAAFFFTTIGNLVLWRTLWSHLELDGLRSVLFLASLPLFLFCVFNLLLTPVLALPYLRRPLLALLVVVSACCTYFMLHYNVLIDRSMVQNVFETNQAELGSYLSLPLVLTVVVLGVLPAIGTLLLRTRPARGRWQALLGWAGNAALSLLVLAAVAGPFYKDYASLLRNNRQIRDQVLPFNFVRNTHGYLVRKHSEGAQPLRPVAQDATRPAAAAGQRPKLVVLVVGETARASNLQLNGYPRDTNPVLSRRRDIISFLHVSSCGTATAISVPCMFSRWIRTEYEAVRAATEENLLDILQRTGVQVRWRNNNNGGCKGVCARVPTEDMPALKVPGHCVNRDGTCLDAVLLHQLQERIDAMPGDALVVLHQLGSHGPTYSQRYPDDARAFTPTCDSNRIQHCSRQALLNTYDNTLVYTDRMLGQTIDLLEGYAGQRDVAMIYVSDHGESLGEHGLYLHGTPYFLAPDEQTHVPLLMWFSPQFARGARLNLDCLRYRAEKVAYSHDNLYHSMLGLFEVQTAVYRPALDVFAGCRAS